MLPRRAVASNLDALADAWEWTGEDVLAHGLPLFHVHGLVLGAVRPAAPRRRAAPPRPLRAGGGRGRAARRRDDAVRRPDDVPPARPRGRADDRAIADGLQARPACSSPAPPRSPRPSSRASSAHRPADRRALRAHRDADEHRGPRRRRSAARLRRRPGARASRSGSSTTTATRSTAPTTRRSARSPSAARTCSPATSTARTRPTRRCATAGSSPATSPPSRADGYWRIVGRRSTDLIKTGGYKVGAGEIEVALLDHPGVHEAAVTGEPDPDLGERIVAWVVAEGDAPGRSAS